MDGILKLNPCPFCTCKAVELEEVTDGEGELICAHVECPACLARGPQEALIQNAIDFWNECEPVLPSCGTFARARKTKGNFYG